MAGLYAPYCDSFYAEKSEQVLGTSHRTFSQLRVTVSTRGSDLPHAHAPHCTAAVDAATVAEVVKVGSNCTPAWKSPTEWLLWELAHP